MTPAATPTQPTSCESCPLYSRGRGFALGVGDPEKARLAFLLEVPNNSEVGFWLNTPVPEIIPDQRAELLRRQGAFPELEKKFLVKGVPGAGAAGAILNNWLFPKVGIVRSEVFIDNVLRCYPQKNKQGQNYPTGGERSGAERACRRYDRIQLFRPDVIVVTYSPASLMRELTALPLIIKDLEKAQAFVKQGLRTLVLMGGRAAEVYLGYASNVARWRGHYELTAKRGGADAWYGRVIVRVETKGKAKRKSKSAQLAAGNAKAIGDVLDVKAPKKRKGGCVCGEKKDKHPTPTCPEYVSTRKKVQKAEGVSVQPSADNHNILRLTGGEDGAKNIGMLDALEQMTQTDPQRPGEVGESTEAGFAVAVLDGGEVGSTDSGGFSELGLAPAALLAQETQPLPKSGT